MTVCHRNVKWKSLPLKQSSKQVVRLVIRFHWTSGRYEQAEQTAPLRDWNQQFQESTQQLPVQTYLLRPLSLPFPPLLLCSFLPLPSLPSCPSISLFRPFPMIQLGGYGSAVSSPSGSGQSPADKRFLAKLEHKIKHLTTTILTGFLIN